MEDPNFRVALNLMLKSMQEAYTENEHINHQIVLTIGPTPQSLLNIDFTQLPIGMTGKVVDKCHFDHGLTKTQLENIYHVISSPRALYKSADPADARIVMSYDYNKAGEPLIAAVHPNKQLAGRCDYYNSVASYYHKGGDAEKRWKAAGLMIWEAPQK